MTAVTCRCGRPCASRSGYAAHARSCPLVARWDAIAFGPGFEKRDTGELWREADAEVKAVLQDGDEVLAQLVLMGVRKELDPRGIHSFTDLHDRFDANELLVDYVGDEPGEYDHVNAVTAYVDRELRETSLATRVRQDAPQF